jgi:hypothetical protein
MALVASRASTSFFLNLSSARSRASFEGVANGASYDWGKIMLD